MSLQEKCNISIAFIKLRSTYIWSLHLATVPKFYLISLLSPHRLQFYHNIQYTVCLTSLLSSMWRMESLSYFFCSSDSSSSDTSFMSSRPLLSEQQLLLSKHQVLLSEQQLLLSIFLSFMTLFMFLTYNPPSAFCPFLLSVSICFLSLSASSSCPLPASICFLSLSASCHYPFSVT